MPDKIDGLITKLSENRSVFIGKTPNGLNQISFESPTTEGSEGYKYTLEKGIGKMVIILSDDAVIALLKMYEQINQPLTP